MNLRLDEFCFYALNYVFRIRTTKQTKRWSRMYEKRKKRIFHNKVVKKILIFRKNKKAFLVL
jgi:hypothetical protein